MALDGGPGSGDGEAAEQTRETGQVAGAVGPVAEIYVFHRCGFHPGLGHGVLDGVGGQRHGRREVEPAAPRLGQPGTGVRHDYCFTHGGPLEFSMAESNHSF